MLHSLEVLNSSGHLTITWDPHKAEEVGEARAMVEKLREEGYTFFVVAGSTGKDEVEQGNGMILVRRIEDPTEDLPPEPGEATASPRPKRARKKTPGKPPPQEKSDDAGRRHVAVRRMAGG